MIQTTLLQTNQLKCFKEIIFKCTQKPTCNSVITIIAGTRARGLIQSDITNSHHLMTQIFFLQLTKSLSITDAQACRS